MSVGTLDGSPGPPLAERHRPHDAFPLLVRGEAEQRAAHDRHHSLLAAAAFAGEGSFSHTLRRVRAHTQAVDTRGSLTGQGEEETRNHRTPTMCSVRGAIDGVILCAPAPAVGKVDLSRRINSSSHVDRYRTDNLTHTMHPARSHSRGSNETRIPCC